AKTPKAIALLAGGNARRTSEVDAGMSSDAASASRMRPHNSVFALGAEPHTNTAASDSADPASNARLRPVRSATTPPRTSVSAATIVYPLRTHANAPALVPLNSRCTSGYTTYMIERLIDGIICATPATNNTRHALDRSSSLFWPPLTGR